MPIRIESQQFRDARVFGGLSREDAAQLLGVSLRTVGHWETGRARPSYAAFRLLRVYRHGELPHPAWQGFRIVRGLLVTPENHTLSPGDMAWQSLLVQRANFNSLASLVRYAAGRHARRTHAAVSLARPLTGLVGSSASLPGPMDAAEGDSGGQMASRAPTVKAPHDVGDRGELSLSLTQPVRPKNPASQSSAGVARFNHQVVGGAA